MLLPFLVGIGSGLSLIMAIGAQNAFVLRQGIRREHVLPVVLICGLTDALLEFAGVAGIGFVIERAPVVLEIVRWGGVAFLLWYAFTAAMRARKPEALVAGDDSAGSLRRTVLACLAITYLNPHVYLDTMVLMGSIGNAQGDPERWWFAVGGAIASVGWFAALGYGSRYLTRFFASPGSWQILDICVAVIMVVLAIRIAFG
ncbi:MULTISPECIES: LysE/ArgO family amino acid transporter [unclassified Leucobacter]|uniref:LysE/ArgO family amino acid transporter n=1 Tax=unclassified Leucobacter TaxID=2621730 RepID=UPI00165DF81F|nr:MULTISPECIES: LysE/ArgO family amino acid transporter [unclassified Leucobacter]MBC9936399.1 amino acid transporter [Leucobacter sp. cx-87]